MGTREAAIERLYRMFQHLVPEVDAVVARAEQIGRGDGIIVAGDIRAVEQTFPFVGKIPTELFDDTTCCLWCPRDRMVSYLELQAARETRWGELLGLVTLGAPDGALLCMMIDDEDLVVVPVPRAEISARAAEQGPPRRIDTRIVTPQGAFDA